MKVKIINSSPTPYIDVVKDLEDKINDFIKDKNVIDIKYQKDIILTALIIYEED